MIKIVDFKQGAKRPTAWDELHTLIDMCFEQDDSFSMVFTRETVEDTKAEIERYCKTKGIEVDQLYLDGVLYVERIISDEPETSSNGKHEPKKRGRFSHIVNALADELKLNGVEIYVPTDFPENLAKSFYNWALNRPELKITFKCRTADKGLYVRKVSR